MKKTNVWTIIRKEFARFFGDRAMVFTAVIMPGLLIYIIYSLMGGAMQEDHFRVSSDEPTTLYVEGMPPSVASMIDSLPQFTVCAAPDAQMVMQELDDKENNVAYAVFPPQFDSLVAAYDPASGVAAPEVRIFYNSSNSGSLATYQLLSEMMNRYEESLCNRFDVNRGDDESLRYDRADEEEMLGSVLSQFIPMLLLMLLFSGCMAVAPPSIAGEKERGTIATLLVTPMRRSDLALGKIVSLSCFATLSGLSSFVGILLSLPKMLNAGADDMNLNIYGASDYVMLLVVLLCTVLLLVSVVANLSALAKDVKQASTLNIPLSLLMIVVGMLPMILGGAPEGMALYLIPFYNSVMSMTSVMAHESAVLPVAVTVASNLLYAVGGAWLLTRLISSERIMFGK